VLRLIADSLDLASPGQPASLDTMLERFDPACLPRLPWVVLPEKLTRAERLR
jgi:glutamyl-tRNA synthetase